MIGHVKGQRHKYDIVSTSSGHLAFGVNMYANTYFSDTLLFWGPYAGPFLNSFVSLICDAVCFGIESGFPLRGAISVGDAILDNDAGVFLGLPIIEAARAEECQEWIGVSIGHTFADERVAAAFDPTLLLPYESQFKKHDEKWKRYVVELAIDWPRRWRETRKSDLRALIKSMDVDSRYSQYYRNTLGFIEFSELNHDWFLKIPNLKPG